MFPDVKMLHYIVSGQNDSLNLSFLALCVVPGLGGLCPQPRQSQNGTTPSVLYCIRKIKKKMEK